MPSSTTLQIVFTTFANYVDYFSFLVVSSLSSFVCFVFALHRLASLNVYAFVVCLRFSGISLCAQSVSQLIPEYIISISILSYRNSL